MSALTLGLLWLLALAGWGEGLRRLLLPASSPPAALRMALGLVVWVWIGAWASVLGLAKALLLDLELAAGLVLCVVWWARARHWRPLLPRLTTALAARRQPATLAGYAVAGVALSVAVLHLVALDGAGIVNYHDDLFKYLVRIARLLQTGRLAGDPFDGSGLDALGGQVLLQSLFVAHGSLAACYVADQGLLLPVAAVLLVQLTRAAGSWPRSVAPAIALFLVFHSQVVNSTASASITLLVLAAAWLLGHLDEVCRGLAPAHPQDRSEVAAACTLGTVVALKNSMIPLALLLGLGLVGVARRRQGGTTWRALGGVGAGVVLTLAPWAFVHADRAVRLLGAPLQALPWSPALTVAEWRFNAIELLSTEATVYGSRPVGDLIVLAILALGSSLAWWRLRTGRATSSGLPLVAAVTGSALLVSWVLALGVADLLTVGRYLRPAARAVLPLLIAVVATSPIVGPAAPALTRRGSWIWRAATLALFTVAIGLDGSTLPAREERLLTWRTPLAFVRSDGATNTAQRALMEQVLRGDYATQLRGLQAKAPAGTGVLAWVFAPCVLDFASHRIVAPNENGVLAPWSPLRLGMSLEQVRAALRREGIAYVLLEHSGALMPGVDQVVMGMADWHPAYAMYTQPGLVRRFLRERLTQLMATSQVLVEAPGIALFSIEPETLQP